jgi:hypothetical protein
MMDLCGSASIIRMDKWIISTSPQRERNSLHYGCLTADNTMTWKEYWQMTKWEWFIEGFANISYIISCYNTPEPYGYDDFWEALSFGFMQMEIYPYDDCYNPKLSKQRKLLYGIRETSQSPKVQLIVQNKDFVAYTDGGYTICAQPDREKANSCLEYYKSQHSDAIVYGSWD